MSENKFATREEWLVQAVSDLVLVLFTPLKLVLPKFKISCGWPSKGAVAKKQRLGQTWKDVDAADGSWNLFISPAIDNPFEVVTQVVHELCHVVRRDPVSHQGGFVELAKSVGLVGPEWVKAQAGPQLMASIGAIVGNLGVYPHGKITTLPPEKKDTIRQVKLECGKCSTICRMSEKSIKKPGPPTCACGGKFAEAAPTPGVGRPKKGVPAPAATPKKKKIQPVPVAEPESSPVSVPTNGSPVLQVA